MSLTPPGQRLAPGFRLDRYELLWPIAEGGMASVWLARLHGKRGFEKLVAVKTILPKFANDPRFETMFLDEARIAAGIEHSNVARVLDLGEEHGVLYIAMEWVDGDSLSKLQRLLARAGVPLPQGVVLRVMADACAGLHAAHELRGRDGQPLGIVHRDVSPQNILVGADGVSKVIDFGVAKARDRVSEETSAGALKGKIQYMAPEQALGRQVDRRADAWSIGAMLYQFFSGRRVFDADSELGTLQLLTSGDAPLPLPPTAPPPIVSIIEGLLQFNPEERWPNLEVVRRQLEQAMVELDCVVRSEDIGNFIATYAHERAASRRATVANALHAADARAVVADAKPSVASASGLIDVQSRSANSLLTPGVPPMVDPRTVPRAQGAEASSSTLGFAALDAQGERRLPMGVWWLGGVAAIGTLVAGVAGLIYVVRSGPVPTTSAAAASPPDTAVVSRPATPPPPTAAPPPPQAPPPPAAIPVPQSPPTVPEDVARSPAVAAPPPPPPATPRVVSAPAPTAPPVATFAPAAPKPVVTASPAPARPPTAPRKPPSGKRTKESESDDGF
jgi:serine/threonine protein kinase